MGVSYTDKTAPLYRDGAHITFIMTSWQGHTFHISFDGEYGHKGPVMQWFPCFYWTWISFWTNNWVASEMRRLNTQTSPTAWDILTHWDRATHICVSKVTIIGSDNGLSPGRRQASIWTNDGILLIGALGTNFSEILIEIQTFSFWKNRLKVSSAKWQPFCLGLNELTHWGPDKMDTSLQTFWNSSSSKKLYVFWFKFHWNTFPRVQLTIRQHWFR